MASDGEVGGWQAEYVSIDKCRSAIGSTTYQLSHAPECPLHAMLLHSSFAYSDPVTARAVMRQNLIDQNTTQPKELTVDVG